MKQGITAVALGFTLGCSSTGPNTDPTKLNGTYQATTFTVQIQGSGRRDVLAAGGSITLTINPGQVTAGRLIIPVAAGLTTTPVDDPLTGRYVTLGASLIRYESEPPGVYIDGLVFTVDPPELRAFLSLTGAQAGLMSVILRKQ